MSNSCTAVWPLTEHLMGHIVKTNSISFTMQEQHLIDRDFYYKMLYNTIIQKVLPLFLDNDKIPYKLVRIGNKIQLTIVAQALNMSFEYEYPFLLSNEIVNFNEVL